MHFHFTQFWDGDDEQRKLKKLRKLLIGDHLPSVLNSSMLRQQCRYSWVVALS